MTYSQTQAGQTVSILGLVNQTLNSLLANFPAWKNSVPATPKDYLDSYRQELLLAMKENGVNSDVMIAKGMRKARATGKPFLPAPGEFCEWCLPVPEDFGMPTLLEAFNQSLVEVGKPSMNRRWSHDVVYLAASSLGFYEIKRGQENAQSLRDLKTRYTEHYTRLTEKVMKGGVLKAPPEHRIENRAQPVNEMAVKVAGESTIKSLMGMFDE